MNKESQISEKPALEDALFDYEKLKRFLTDRIPVEIMLWKDKVMKNRNDAFAYSMVGMLSVHIDEFDEAIKYLYKSIEIDPENARHWDQIAFALEKQGNVLKAIDYYKAALLKDNKRVGTLFRLGNCYNMLGKRGKAIKCYEDIIELEPDNCRAFTELGILWFKEKNLSKALLYLFECLKFIPQNSYLLNIIGQVYEEMGNHKEAFDYYLKAIKIKPSKKEFWVDIIELLNNNGKEKNAHYLLKRALHNFPNDETLLNIKKKLNSSFVIGFD